MNALINKDIIIANFMLGIMKGVTHLVRTLEVGEVEGDSSQNASTILGVMLYLYNRRTKNGGGGGGGGIRKACVRTKGVH